MTTITDFASWLDQADPEGHEEVYSLYRAVQDRDEWGPFNAKPARGGDGVIVYADHIDDTLLLASEKAFEAFSKEIERRYVDSDLNIEGWYEFRRSMAKHD